VIPLLKDCPDSFGEGSPRKPVRMRVADRIVLLVLFQSDDDGYNGHGIHGKSRKE
jgi:hypothetical protein